MQPSFKRISLAGQKSHDNKKQSVVYRIRCMSSGVWTKQPLGRLDLRNIGTTRCKSSIYLFFTSSSERKKNEKTNHVESRAVSCLAGRSDDDGTIMLQSIDEDGIETGLKANNTLDANDASETK